MERLEENLRCVRTPQSSICIEVPWTQTPEMNGSNGATEAMLIRNQAKRVGIGNAGCSVRVYHADVFAVVLIGDRRKTGTGVEYPAHELRPHQSATILPDHRFRAPGLSDVGQQPDGGYGDASVRGGGVADFPGVHRFFAVHYLTPALR